MPKSPTHIGPPYGHENSVFTSPKYLAWLTDLEFTGRDDEAVDQVLYVATGYKSGRGGTDE